MDEWWSAFLGCEVPDLQRPGVRVFSNGGAYHGVHAFCREDAVILSVPEGSVDDAREATGGAEPSAVFRPEVLRELFGSAVDRVIGPAYLGTVAREWFRPVEDRGTRLLGPEDEGALSRLQEECTNEEWAHGSIEWGAHPVFGCFVGGELAAAGTLEAWSDGIRHVGIVTHPRFRGTGYGKAVVSAMTAHALAGGLVVQYRTLCSNAPSVEIAKSLGFREYARTLALRFR